MVRKNTIKEISENEDIWRSLELIRYHENILNYGEEMQVWLPWAQRIMNQSVTE